MSWHSPCKVPSEGRARLRGPASANRATSLQTRPDLKNVHGAVVRTRSAPRCWGRRGTRNSARRRFLAPCLGNGNVIAFAKYSFAPRPILGRLNGLE